MPGTILQYNAPQVRRESQVVFSPVYMYRSYQLEVIQHPEKTAEFRNAHLSRLPLNPPLIARLIVRDSSGNLVIP